MRLLLATILALLGLAAPAAAASINDNTIGTATNQFQYTGHWVHEHRSDTYQGDDHYDQTAGDSYQVAFSGNQAQVYTAKDTGLGIMAVSVDGGDETMIDTYSPTRLAQQLVYTTPTLADGTHTLKVRVTGTKNPSAAHAFISADRVDITTNPPPPPPPPPPPTGDTILRHMDFEPGGTLFDSSNGSVSYSTDQAYAGTQSAKVLIQANSINRGWTWQDPTDYCAGANDGNTFAPVDSNRSISGEFYLTDPAHTVGERLVALSYDNGDCVGGPTSSILAVTLDAGTLYLHSSNYGGNCPGCNETTYSPRVAITGNQWVKVEMRFHVARDNTGWAQLIVNDQAYPPVSGPTLTTAWGNYNETQWGEGWSDTGTATQYVYIDDATLASF